VPAPTLLVGWARIGERIAAVVGVALNTRQLQALARRKKHRLPTVRIGRGRRRPRGARQDELDAWAKREYADASAQAIECAPELSGVFTTAARHRPPKKFPSPKSKGNGQQPPTTVALPAGTSAHAAVDLARGQGNAASPPSVVAGAPDAHGGA
jgi:hypothetical protein